MSLLCQIEDCDEPAPFGYRKPGPISAIPADKRSYLWVCRAHRSTAEERRNIALGLKPSKQQEETQ